MQAHFIIFWILKCTSISSKCIYLYCQKKFSVTPKKSENSPKLNKFVQLQMSSGFIQNENVFNFVHRFRPRYFMSAPSLPLPTSRLSGLREIKSEEKKLSIYRLKKKKRLFLFILHSFLFFSNMDFFFFFFSWHPL